MYYKQEGFHTSTNLPFTELTPDYSGIAYWLQVLLVFNYFYLFFLLIDENRPTTYNHIYYSKLKSPFTKEKLLTNCPLIIIQQNR